MAIKHAVTARRYQNDERTHYEIYPVNAAPLRKELIDWPGYAVLFANMFRWLARRTEASVGVPIRPDQSAISHSARRVT